MAWLPTVRPSIGGTDEEAVPKRVEVGQFLACQRQNPINLQLSVAVSFDFRYNIA